MKTQIYPFIFMLSSFLLLFLLSSCTSEPEKPVPVVHTIVISAMQFNPAELTLQKGDTVVFVNKDLVATTSPRNPTRHGLHPIYLPESLIE